jgi:hypothetical protein
MFARLLSVMALLLLVSGLSAQGKEMLRITETRFVPSEAKPGDEVRLEVGLEVLPGYHAYGTLDENGTVPELTLSDAQGLVAKGQLIWPEGDPHEKYGLMNYWVMGKATLAQVYVVPKGASGELTVKGKVGGQICNEGMCYQVDGIDFTAKLKVLGAAQPAAQPATGEPGVDEPAVGDPDPGMPGMGQGFGEPDFGQQLIAELKLEPATARPGEVVTIRVNVIPPLGKHVYGGKQEGPQRTTLSLIGDGGTKPLGYSQLPDGEPHGSDFWLSDPFDIVQRVYVPEHMPAGELNFLARLDYMVCDETMCDPPAHKEFKVSLPIELGEVRKEHAPSAEDIEALKQLGTVSELKGEGEGGPGEGAAGTGSSDVEGGAGGGSNSPADKPLLAFILLAIGWGLFALVMPCTYPMIPITISFFTKQASARGGSVLPLSLMYGLGIVLIFILIGLIVGPAIIPFATHYVTNILIGVVFVLFALSLFGVFTLQPPKFLMNSASKASMKGGYVGVFLMGATLVVTSFTLHRAVRWQSAGLWRPGRRSRSRGARYGRLRTDDGDPVRHPLAGAGAHQRAAQERQLDEHAQGRARLHRAGGRAQVLLQRGSCAASQSAAARALLAALVRDPGDGGALPLGHHQPQGRGQGRHRRQPHGLGRGDHDLRLLLPLRSAGQ